MKYAIDRIVDNIVILESIKNKEIIKVDKELLPQNIKEGSILIKRKDSYILSKSITRKDKIKRRFNKLKRRL
jgi:hypothetical protein